MFMKFDLFQQHNPHDFEAPVGSNDKMPQQKICLNLKNIDNVQQSGQYQQIPVEPRPGEVPDELRGIELEVDGLGRPRPARRPARPAREQRRREVFVMDTDRFIIIMQNGHNYTVMGKFDEFCDTLTNFREKLETV